MLPTGRKGRSYLTRRSYDFHYKVKLRLDR